MRPKQHITAAIEKQSEQAKKNYQIHLTATIDCIRFLLRQGLAFRGNDETDDSVNQGNFLELLNFLAQHNEEIGRAFKNARGNLKLIAPSIQKDIVRAAARETTKVIVDDLGDELFAVLVDEARDISIKEQMSVCLRNDQDIVNAMALVKVSKQRLQNIRDDGWSLLLDEVSLFCDKHDITVPIMDDIFVSQGRSRRKAQKISNLHHFQVEIFYQVVDRQLQELNNRFTEVNTELLLCIACLNPRHSFFAFDKEKLIQLAQFYPLEFSSTQLLALDSQLENFILDVRSDDQFSDLNGIGALSQKLVETRKILFIH
ncbi:Zinc finger MYM-type protein [Arachis hypogaea]|nr:Zinc finger MYM-type protein [Arachis hypogaea]